MVVPLTVVFGGALFGSRAVLVSLLVFGGGAHALPGLLGGPEVSAAEFFSHGW